MDLLALSVHVMSHIHRKGKQDTMKFTEPLVRITLTPAIPAIKELSFLLKIFSCCAKERKLIRNGI